MKKSLDCFTLLLIVLIVSLSPNCATNQAFTNERVKETITTFNQLLQQKYVDESLAMQVAQTLKTLTADGYFDEATTPEIFAPLLEAKVQAITQDKHLYIRANKKKVKASKSSPKRQPIRSKAEMLDSNIGYLKVNSFVFENTAIDALVEKVIASKYLIIDLRENGGGDPNKVKYLSSYFFNKPTHLNTLYWRKGNRYDEYWTKEIPEKRLNQASIYVLTSTHTFSAAEEFTYNLQALKRATIIGEQTGGGANPGRLLKINKDISAFIPEGKAINPITKTNWANGIVPDVKCERDEALEVALQEVRKEIDG